MCAALRAQSPRSFGSSVRVPAGTGTGAPGTPGAEGAALAALLVGPGLTLALTVGVGGGERAGAVTLDPDSLQLLSTEKLNS